MQHLVSYSLSGSAAQLWPAFLAAAAAFGGTHPLSLQGVPWPGAGRLRELVGDGRGLGAWAPDDYAQAIACLPPVIPPIQREAVEEVESRFPNFWRGWARSDADPPKALEYGGGRTFARLELEGESARLVIGHHPPRRATGRHFYRPADRFVYELEPDEQGAALAALDAEEAESLRASLERRVAAAEAALAWPGGVPWVRAVEPLPEPPAPAPLPEDEDEDDVEIVRRYSGGDDEDEAA